MIPNILSYLKRFENFSRMLDILKLMAKTYRQRIGTMGEDIALNWLNEKGYELVQRNFRFKNDEIDLIMLKDDVLFFVEVKTRRNDNYGLAEYAMTPKKLNALFRCIDHYLYTQDKLDMEWQLDLIVVEKFQKDKAPKIFHFENLGLYDD